MNWQVSDAQKANLLAQQNAQQAPAAIAPSTPASEPTGLQFGTAGVGTGVTAPQTIPQVQNPYQPQMQQQMMRQNPYQQPQYGGLQQLLSQMIGRYQQPQQRAYRNPQYQSRALGYRPDMAVAQQNLGRTATTAAEAQAAAAAKAAEAGAQAEEDQGFLNWQRQQYANR
jgi:hypothetical protein